MKPKLNYLIICDDIRQEIGNKQTLVGIYLDHIYVPQFQYKFPKLCMYLSLEGITKKGKLDIYIKKAGKKKNIYKFENIDLMPPAGKKIKQILLSFVISPFVAEEEGSYLVDMIFDKNINNKVSYKFNIDYLPEQQKGKTKSNKK